MNALEQQISRQDFTAYTETRNHIVNLYVQHDKGLVTTNKLKADVALAMNTTTSDICKLMLTQVVTVLSMQSVQNKSSNIPN